MKKLTFALFLIPIFSTFANGFDRMSIEEIYDRGYAIKATVDVDLGIRFTAGDETSEADHRSWSECYVILKEPPKKDSILKHGRTFVFGGVGSAKDRGESDALINSTDPAVKSVWYPRGTYDHKDTFSDVKKWCTNLKMEIVENTTLEEL